MSWWYTPAWAQQLLQQMPQQIQLIQQQIGKLMALVQVEQTDLDTLATNLETAVTAVGTEIKDLEAKIAAGQPLPAGSLDGLNTALTNLQALEVPAPTPPAV